MQTIPEIKVSEDGNTITVELTPDLLCLITCALNADHYAYASEYRSLKYQLEVDLRRASQTAESYRRAEADL